MKTLILWDIDGTLTTTSGKSPNGAIVEEFVEAAKTVSGQDDILPPTFFHGSTDFGVFENIFQNSGFSDFDSGQMVLKAIAELERKTTNPDYIQETIQPVLGARDALNFLSKDHIQTYATGNSPARAQAKLACFAMDQYLDPTIGGFGFWTASRPDFLKRAIDLSAQKYGQSDCVIVVGDTPNDIKAAREIGALSIAVAGGNYSIENLEKDSPDLLIKDFSQQNIQSIVEFIK